MGERVWIIGASYGIGAAVAERLVADGAEVVASARGMAKLEELAARHPAAIFPVSLDVTDKATVEAALVRIERERGPIDTVILNAGTHKPISATDFRVDGLRQLFELNVFGVANALEVVMPRMIARRGGRILIVASLAGYRGLPTAAYYGASKAALVNMAEALKFDLDRHGVTIQLVDPGFVRTPLTDRNEFPMPFLIEPTAAAEAIVRGMRGSRFEIAFPWAFVFVMKLLRILPYRLFFPLVAKATRG